MAIDTPSGAWHLSTVTALKEIEFDEELGPGIELNESPRIIDNPKQIESRLCPEFLKQAGQIEVDTILEAPALIVSEREYNDKPSTEDILTEQALLVSFYELSLWFEKDNSVSHSRVFLMLQSDQRTHVISRGSRAEYSSDGRTAVARFSRNGAGHRTPELCGNRQRY